MDEDAAPLLPVEPGYRHVLRVRTALGWAVLLVPALILDAALLRSTAFAWILPAAVGLIGLAAVVIVPGRVYRRLRYRLTERMLQVVRGWMIHVDTIVPLVRVQHIDLTRGPVDKVFGTATLVVHTAGTHNSIVTLPGLSPERAALIRDTIRAEVRTDHG